MAEIGIAQVAPAGDAHGVVGNEQLVVHALLHPRKIAQGTDHAPQRRVTGTGHRVEHAHFDVGLKGQAHHLRVRAGGVEVVQQHAHAHAAPGCGHHAAQQTLGAGIGVNGVVLQVQRFLGRLDQCQAAAIGRLGAGEQQKAGFKAPTRRRAALLHLGGQRGACGGFQRR